MSNNKITNLAKPTDDKDGVNKKYIDDNYLKLSGGTMTGHIILNNAVLTSQYQAISRNTGNAFFVQITNPYVYHQFNMVKNKIINLGDPADATNSGGNTAYMYYIKIIVNFQKTVSGTFYSLDLYVNIPQKGIDLNTYPKNWTNNWMIAYGVFGKVSSIDPQKTYDYHTAFDIKPTEVVYNVDLDMNRKKILNIAPDKTKNNSAATVKMVKDLETKLSPHTTNNAYREIFEEFYDFSDASIYKFVH